MAATSQSLLSPAPPSLPRARLALSAHRAVALRRRAAFPAVAAASTSMASSESDEKKESKLWGGRFEEGVTDAVERFTESISYDWQLYKYDIMGSKAHASMLAAQGLITTGDRDIILEGLDQIEKQIQDGKFEWRKDREDVHIFRPLPPLLSSPPPHCHPPPPDASPNHSSASPPPLSRPRRGLLAPPRAISPSPQTPTRSATTASFPLPSTASPRRHPRDRRFNRELELATRRPHGTKSNPASRDCSMDPTEPRWRMNSSFSPPASRGWDCMYSSDGLPHRTHDAPHDHPPYVSSLSSHSKGSRSAFGSDQYLNHHHSVSDGALSYFGSPVDSLQAPRWTPSLQRFDLGEFSTPAGGPKPESSDHLQSSERHLTAVSSFSSASPFSETSQMASSSKRPASHLPRNHLGRRSFMSTPVYPLVFRNPVSEAGASGMPEASNAGRTTPSDDSQVSPVWRRSLTSPELKFHDTLSELRKMEASPGPNTSSRREGFRWSSASSYDFGYDGEAIDISDHISVESQRSPTSSVSSLKCGLCERFLRQKSPWSSNRIVRNTNMPVAAVLPCRHVFHADCLEESTPKSEVHEPPCPLCVRATDSEGCVSFSEPLHVALRSARRNQSISFSSGGAGGSSSGNPPRNDHVLKRNQSAFVPRRSGSLFRNRLKKQFPFKGRIGKEFFGGRVFRKVGSTSSSGQQDEAAKPDDQSMK